MTDPKMTCDEFWTIVEKVDWTQLVSDGVKRPYEEGGERLLKLLPTIDDMRDFTFWFQKARGQLTTALDHFEQNTGKRVPVSDDGWSDLSSMVIGLGREVFRQTLADPSLLMKRSEKYTGVDGYVESFAYCMPGSDDYDPVEVKLARAVSGLNHWQEQVEENGGPEKAPKYMVRDVENWKEQVRTLRAELERQGGEEWTQERYQEHLEEEQRKRDELYQKRREERMARFEEKQKAKAEFLQKYGSWD